MASTPRQIVKAINDHCDKGNGIYVRSGIKGAARFFRAKVIEDLDGLPCAYVTPDFGDSWLRLPDDVVFYDGNWNAPIPGLPTERS